VVAVVVDESALVDSPPLSPQAEVVRTRERSKGVQVRIFAGYGHLDGETWRARYVPVVQQRGPFSIALQGDRASGAAHEVWTQDPTAQVRAYVWLEIGLAAVVQGKDIYYWMGAPDCEARLAVALRDTSWRASEQLRLYALDEEMLEIQLVPLPPLDELAGPTVLEELALRVGEARGSTVLVRGPSGAGKTTVARRLAARAMGPGARMLQIPTEILGVLESSQLREIVSILQPDVLVIDDIVFGEDEPDLLTRLEAVRSDRTFVVITQMTAPGEVADGVPEPGSLYRPGMRPGRIDGS
jgi:hypothetical protein